MPKASQILCYGADLQLLQTRGWVLEHAGFEVTLAIKTRKFEQLLLSGDFDLLILCRSLNSSQCDTAARFASVHQPELRVLSLCDDASAICSSNGLTPLDSPDVLLSSIEKALAKPVQ